MFLYGTLRPLGAQATHTLSGYRLYDLGRFPCIIPSEGGEVHGNLTEVDDALLADFDRVEGVARSFYTRETVSVKSMENGNTIEGVFVYVAGNVLQHDVTLTEIPSGDWHNHSGKQAHVFSPYR